MATAFNEARATDPTITASGGTFVGKADGTIQQFYGIPFAEPPPAVYVGYIQAAIVVWQRDKIWQRRLRVMRK